MNITIKKLNSKDIDFKSKLKKILDLNSMEHKNIEHIVSQILTDVKNTGDDAVLKYTKQLDRLNVTNMTDLEISYTTIQNALKNISNTHRTALLAAAKRIFTYHEHQYKHCGSDGFFYTDTEGTILGQKVTSIDCIGIYVPGGKATYPSSVLMNTIPARVAGVKEIIMVVPMPNNVNNELVLAAAAITGVSRIFKIGGAQAIGALAYGTTTIPAVDKIVGPGNAYVAAAKRQVFGKVGIDMLAGPSEILIICDNSANPDWVAMDLFSQAEHDELAQSILLCPDVNYISKVEMSIQKQLNTMLRKDIIQASLTNRSVFITTSDLEEACDIANLISSEHVEIFTQKPQQLINKIKHAGAIFLGQFSSEAIGDYSAGQNHVLPTSRTARFSSPLGVYDFQKRSNIINVSPESAKTLGLIAEELAYCENLQAHAKAAKLRFN